MPTVPEIRPLTADDAEAATELKAEAFGASSRPAPDPWPSAGTRAWGAVADRALVAVVEVHALASWFGGREVATAGIAGVAVRPEHRGTGLLAPLFAAVVADARARGEAVSTMFPTAPGIYRRLGYEVVGELVDVEVPVAPLARIPAPTGVVLRRADRGDARDVAAQRAVYDRWAAAQDGPLTREGPLRDRLEHHGTVTLAHDGDGRPVGYAAWRRTDGYQAGHAPLPVHELVALTAPATTALWRMFGGFASVAGAVVLRTSGADLSRLALPAGAWRPVRQWPYGMRLLDVVTALEARGVAPVDATLPFAVAGDGLDGGYRLTASDGLVTCVRGRGTGPVFAGRGLALLYAGVQSCANLRFAGLLTGPDTDDATWDALFGGRPFHIRNYF